MAKMNQGTARMSPNTSKVLSVIMGGGAGTRLFPLTKERAKPAVPLAGKYRLVDIPISNCINSNLKRIYLLTQFNSASLHRHISQSYKFDPFSGGFVEILAAEQTFSDTSWYQGTADAVRKNLVHLLNHDFDYVLILSGDQLYRMDFRKMLAQHVESDAQLTIATIPVHRHEAAGLGIMQIPFIINFFWSLKHGKKVTSDNPWGATTLEWQTPTPPPHGNFDKEPEVHRGPYDYSLPGAKSDFTPQNQPL